MIDALMGAGGWFLIQSAATALPAAATTPPVPAPGWFVELAVIVNGLVSIGFLVLICLLIPVAWSFRKGYHKLAERLDRLQADLHPILQQARAIGEDIGHVSAVVRADMGQIHTTLTATNDRIQQAAAIAETRLAEFGALLEVVQQEAEELFVSAASTVRGVRKGAEAFGRRDGPELASRGAMDDTARSPDPVEDFDDVEDTDGDDDLADGSPGKHGERPIAPPAPRLRPRPRHRRWS